MQFSDFQNGWVRCVYIHTKLKTCTLVWIDQSYNHILLKSCNIVKTMNLESVFMCDPQILELKNITFSGDFLREVHKSALETKFQT